MNWSRVAVALTIFAMLCFVAVQQSRYKGLHHWFNYQPMPLREGLTDGQINGEGTVDLQQIKKLITSTSIYDEHLQRQTFGLYAEFMYKSGGYQGGADTTKNTMLEIDLKDQSASTSRTLILQLEQDGNGGEGGLDLYLTSKDETDKLKLNQSALPKSFSNFGATGKIFIVLNKTFDGMYNVRILVKEGEKDENGGGGGGGQTVHSKFILTDSGIKRCEGGSCTKTEGNNGKTLALHELRFKVNNFEIKKENIDLVVATQYDIAERITRYDRTRQQHVWYHAVEEEELLELKQPCTAGKMQTKIICMESGTDENKNDSISSLKVDDSKCETERRPSDSNTYQIDCHTTSETDRKKCTIQEYYKFSEQARDAMAKNLKLTQEDYSSIVDEQITIANEDCKKCLNENFAANDDDLLMNVMENCAPHYTSELNLNGNTNFDPLTLDTKYSYDRKASEQANTQRKSGSGGRRGGQGKREKPGNGSKGSAASPTPAGTAAGTTTTAAGTATGTTTTTPSPSGSSNVGSDIVSAFNQLMGNAGTTSSWVPSWATSTSDDQNKTIQVIDDNYNVYVNSDRGGRYSTGGVWDDLYGYADGDSYSCPNLNSKRNFNSMTRKCQNMWLNLYGNEIESCYQYVKDGYAWDTIPRRCKNLLSSYFSLSRDGYDNSRLSQLSMKDYETDAMSNQLFCDDFCKDMPCTTQCQAWGCSNCDGVSHPVQAREITEAVNAAKDVWQGKKANNETSLRKLWYMGDYGRSGRDYNHFSDNLSGVDDNDSAWNAYKSAVPVSELRRWT